jgi:ribonuclease HII
MLVYAGIDEAGYGPLLGPLVIARSIFVLEQQEPTREPPSMWRMLGSSVCKKPGDKKNRVAVNDSKKLYQPFRSLKHIERGVLSFLSASGQDPKNLDDLLENLAYDPLSSQIKQDWYKRPDGDPQVPLHLPVSQIDRSKDKLRRALLDKSIHPAGIKAAVVFEDRFNQMVRVQGSKAGCTWAFVSGHLEYIWSRFGEHHPLVIVDRQGGRKKYKKLLASAFFPAETNVLHEDHLKSGYRISDGARKMDVLVQVKSEQQHFPVALASMTAKYLRELLMARFQNFWSFHAPEVKPTCGYYVDGMRFLEEIQPLITEMNIDPENLIRCR